LALSKSSPNSFEATSALPALNDLQHLKLIGKFHVFIKHMLKINQLAKQLDYSKNPSTPSYCDIMSTTDHDMMALDDSSEKTAESFLTSTQALQLRRAHNKVWAGATYLDKKTTNANNPLKVQVELLDLLKNFHKSLSDGHARNCPESLVSPQCNNETEQQHQHVLHA
jgi:hypothetical protein